MANKKGSKQLTWTNRLQIEAWQKAGISKSKMAAFLGVSLRTVYNELSRGEYTHLNTDYTVETRYSPDIAEKKYQEHLRVKSPDLKIGNDYEYAEYVEKMIGEKKYSPEAVIGEIRQKGLKFNTSLSKQTIYRYIEQGIFLTLTNDSLPISCKSEVREEKCSQSAEGQKHRRPSERGRRPFKFRTLGDGQRRRQERNKGNAFGADRKTVAQRAHRIDEGQNLRFRSESPQQDRTPSRQSSLCRNVQDDNRRQRKRILQRQGHRNKCVRRKQDNFILLPPIQRIRTRKQ